MRDPRTIELPPQTVAYARDSARRGVPFTSLVRSYRIGHAEFWKLRQQPVIDRFQTDDRAVGPFEEIDQCSTFVVGAFVVQDRGGKEFKQFATQNRMR